ncbi:ABC transporter permease [Blastococcus haudaquaticus]|uniref:Sulfonate transport system permease protein n=1 Tax=Blastococcus haudaquaticus TaxID=1938745 RepID=A0A286GWE3_9ACTN|nr:ABC transporter permease [Blastococcus haudaquaticus]SOD99399.1 sulfonate transport system permease protein [Blastococcus haudaquaticus]
MTRVLRIGQALAVPLALLGLWELAAQAGWVNPVFVPAPSRIAEAGYDMLQDGGLLEATGETTVRALLGLLLAIVVAVPVGMLIGASRIADEVTRPSLEFFRAMPTVTVIPALMILVGIGHTLALVAIMFAAVWPILLGAVHGVRGIERTLVDVARVHRLGPVAATLKVRLPAALPGIVTGVRISLAIALVVALVAEMMTGNGGLGSLVIEARSRYRSADVFGIVVVMGVVGLLLNSGMVWLEKRAGLARIG